MQIIPFVNSLLSVFVCVFSVLEYGVCLAQ